MLSRALIPACSASVLLFLGSNKTSGLATPSRPCIALCSTLVSDYETLACVDKSSSANRLALPLQRTAVVVRSYSPTAKTIARLLETRKDLRAAGIDLWISVDVTRLTGKRTLHQLSKETDMQFHAYDQEELVSCFPGLLEACSLMPCGINSTLGLGERSLAWGFHAECILLWWRKSGRAYDYVWVIEDDVGCDGNLSEALMHYVDEEGNDADLISFADVNHEFGGLQALKTGLYKGLWPNPIRVPPFGEDRCAGWNWSYVASPAYLKSFDSIDVSSKVCTAEFVQRFSRRMLEALDAWASSGRHAWSEQMIPTVCMVEGLAFQGIAAQHVGKPFQWNGRVDEQAWHATRMHALRRQGPPRLYHALKF